jgi:hypothetical protein
MDDSEQRVSVNPINDWKLIELMENEVPEILADISDGMSNHEQRLMLANFLETNSSSLYVYRVSNSLRITGI